MFYIFHNSNYRTKFFKCNLLNKYKTPQQPKPAQINSQDSLLNNVKPKNQTDTPKQAPETQKSRYIPSPEGVKLKNEAPSAEVDVALRQADAAEKQALDILGGKLG